MTKMLAYLLVFGSLFLLALLSWFASFKSPKLLARLALSLTLFLWAGAVWIVLLNKALQHYVAKQHRRIQETSAQSREWLRENGL